MNLPQAYERDIKHAEEILKQAGCGQIFLFGSLVEGNHRKNSDIDLAIKGVPKGRFYHLAGRLLRELDHPVDLVNLDQDDSFARYLEKEGGLLQVA